MLDDMDKKRARNISLVILIVTLMAGVGFVIGGGDNSPETEPAFEIEYNQNSVQVVQTQGETVDSVEFRVTYFDQQSENLELTDPADSIFLADISRPVQEINESTVVYDGEVQVTSELPDELRPSAPSISDSLPSTQYQPSENVQLSAQNLVQSDSSVDSYRWEMGDGTTYEQSSITHTYEETGVYTAELQVTNTRGETSVQSYTINVEESDSDEDDPNDNPNGGDNNEDLIIGSPEIPNSVDSGQIIDLDAGGFTTNSVESYTWRMGDGTEYSEPAVSHSYEDSGSFDIDLTVSDGSQEESQQYNIIVEEPEVSIDPSIEVIETSGLNVTLTAEGSSPRSEIDSYQWSFGDGNSVERSITEVQHSYSEGGSYSVTLTAVVDGQESSRTTTVSVSSTTDDGSDDGSDDGTDDDSNNDGTDDGSDDGTDDGTNDDGTDDTTDGSTVDVRLNSTGDGYTVESVTPSGKEDELLSTDEIGSDNPAIYLETGNRYVFELGQVAYDNPLEIRNEEGDVLLSMTEVGSLETDNNINWIEQGTEVRFTATQELIDQSSVYSSSEDAELEGDIKQYEDVEPRSEREADVVIQMDNNADNYWRVTDVTGSESYNDVVPDAEPADSNPTIHLTEGLRYRFEGIPNASDEEDLSLSFLDIVGEEILSQNREGTFNDDPQVGWVDNGDSVEFTVSSEISGEFERYHAPEEGAEMKGSIIVD